MVTLNYYSVQSIIYRFCRERNGKELYGKHEKLQDYRLENMRWETVATLKQIDVCSVSARIARKKLFISTKT